MVGALSFRATLGAARLVSRCESVSSSRLSGSSSPLPIVWQCRVGELYPCLVRDTAFKSFAWSRIRLHTVHLLHNENPST